MCAAPFRDSTASLFRRIHELESANYRLRKRTHDSLVAGRSSLPRALASALAATLFGSGVVIGCIALGFGLSIVVAIAMAIFVGGVELLIL